MFKLKRKKFKSRTIQERNKNKMMMQLLFKNIKKKYVCVFPYSNTI